MKKGDDLIFIIGDYVSKPKGYKFVGYVIGYFVKRDGLSIRYAVENDDGIIHIFNANQLEYE